MFLTRHRQAGAGGVDAMDWAQMLERMYLRWADSQGFKSTVVDRLEGLHVVSMLWHHARTSCQPLRCILSACASYDQEIFQVICCCR